MYFILFLKPVFFKNPRIFIRIKNYVYMPYVRFYSFGLIEKKKWVKNSFFSGFKSLWKALCLWILPIFVLIFSIVFLMTIRILPANIILFEWFALSMFLYWLLSGFVFFIKKYQYSRYTSVIQRFWRRSYILFWLIESCLLIVFFYLTLNSSQESLYMLDQIQIFKSHLFSWRFFLPKLFLVSFLVILGYILSLNIKWNIFNKNLTIIFFITILLLYLLWSEFYQIYHVSNFYSNLFWSFELDDRIWVLESDVRRTRIVNHYVMLLFILKFWHIVFIFGFWVFFILRINELNRVRYPLYSANFQNFIILYIMTWLFMYPWFKFTFHKFLQMPYFWFYLNTHKIGFRIFIHDFKLIFYGIAENFNSFYKSFYLYNWNFFFWFVTTNDCTYSSFRKHTIRNYIITKCF